MHFFKQTIIISISGLMLLTACKGKDSAPQSQQPKPVPVTTIQVTATSIPFHDEYPAVLVPLNQSEIRAQVTGYITGVHFTDGGKVSKGQKLYTIDQQMYQANYQQAVANVELQKTNLVKAQKDAARYHELDKKDAIAKQQVDYADAALAAAQKQVAAAQAAANAQKATVSFATIYAPFSGTIGISQVRQGTSVVAGQTILNTVSTDNPMAADITIDQKDIYKFSKLQQTKGLADSTFSLVFNGEVYPQGGHIQTIDRAVDPQTGAIKVRLSFPNNQGLLRGGMSGNIRILNNSNRQSVIIPHKAVTEQLGSFFVYVVGEGSKVTQRKVTLGRQLGANVIVLEGLNDGETITVEGIQNLREGSLITTDTTTTKK